MNNVIKAAVVGAGRIARQHLACLKTLAGVEVAAVCDISRVRAEYMAEAFGVERAFSDFATMLDEVAPGVVHVTTPPPSHFSLASQAIRAGAHVFVEKPICVAYSDFVTLRALAAERHRFLVEDQNYLWNPEVRRTLQWMADGKLGQVVGLEIFFAVPFSNTIAAPGDMPGGQVFDFLPHMAYLTKAFVGDFHEVRTLWQPDGGVHGYDEFRAAVLCRDGPATLALSGRSQPNEFRVTVHGSQARVHLNLLEPFLLIEPVRTGRPALAIATNGIKQACAHSRAAFGGLWGRIAGAPGSYRGIWELVRRTYCALRAGAPPPVSLDDIESTQRLVAALTQQHSNSSANHSKE